VGASRRLPTTTLGTNTLPEHILESPTERKLHRAILLREWIAKITASLAD
jgi:hypothetical protein